MIVPSFYLAYNLLQERKYSQKVELFINNEFISSGYTLIYKQTKFNTNPRKIELAFLTKKFTNDEIKMLNQRLKHYDILNTKLTIRQNTTDLKSEILNEIGNQNNVLNARDVVINNLQKELNEYKVNYPDVVKEMAILFPEIKNVSLGKHIIHQSSDSAKNITVMVYQLDNPKAKLDTNKISLWLHQKLKTNAIKLVREN
jgi:hypothetical protein